MVADLGREGLVASYVEVGSASDFVGGYALAGLDIAKDSYFCHGPLVGGSGREEGEEEGISRREFEVWVRGRYGLRQAVRADPDPFLRLPFQPSSLPTPKPRLRATFGHFFLGQSFVITNPPFEQRERLGYAIFLNFRFN